MAQPNSYASSSGSTSRQRPSSVDSPSYSPMRKESSVLLSIIPSMVRGRLPRLPSLRRSASMYGLKAHNSFRSRPGTPPNEHSAMVLGRSTIGDQSLGTMNTGYFTEELAMGEEEEKEAVRREQRRAMELTEEKSGIGWKFAGQGLSLLSLSITESSALSHNVNSNTASTSFARQLYVHAITYLLRGLPGDLTTEEGLSVRSALPQGMVLPVRVEVGGDEAQSFHESRNKLQRGIRDSQPSVLHRALATSIINFFVVVQFLLPYIKALLRAAYEYERNHHISEKVLAGSIDTVDSLGRIGMRGSGALWASGLALGVGDTVAWIAEEVTSGIQEGLGEGMARVGVKKEVEVKRPTQL